MSAELFKNFESQLQIQSLCSEIKSVKKILLLQWIKRVEEFKDLKMNLLYYLMQDLGDYAKKNNMEICHEVGWLMASVSCLGID